MLFEHYCLLTKKHTGWCYSLRITEKTHAIIKNASPTQPGNRLLVVGVCTVIE